MVLTGLQVRLPCGVSTSLTHHRYDDRNRPPAPALRFAAHAAFSCSVAPRRGIADSHQGAKCPIPGSRQLRLRPRPRSPDFGPSYEATREDVFWQAGLNAAQAGKVRPSVHVGGPCCERWRASPGASWRRRQHLAGPERAGSGHAPRRKGAGVARVPAIACGAGRAGAPRRLQVPALPARPGRGDALRSGPGRPPGPWAGARPPAAGCTQEPRRPGRRPHGRCRDRARAKHIPHLWGGLCHVAPVASARWT